MRLDYGPAIMSMHSTAPLIGVTACLKLNGETRAHTVVEKYVEAVVQGTAGIPVLIPAIGDALDIDGLLDRLDGILVTGSPSNVAPEIYGGPPAREGNLADPERDATTLPLIRRAVARGVPLLAICRGIQELNVAMGGTLHQHVHELPGHIDHRSDKTKPMPERYCPVHPILIRPGGRLAGLLDGEAEAMVNSLHGQGLDRLAPGLAIEATAPDGTIEAVSVPNSPGFALGVQWHPEWRVLENPISRRLFQAFAAACTLRAATRSEHERAGVLA
jgi:putative glutamine amidotransferase